MVKRFRWLGLLLALAWVCSACRVLPQGETPTTVPTPPGSVTVTGGLIRDAVTKLPISGAALKAGEVTALSDVAGAFSIRTLSEAEMQVSAAGYETAQIRARAAYPLMVDLVPDAATTFQILYSYEKQHEFGREYDLLHPDVQALISRDEFVRYMEQQRPYDIVGFTVGAANVLVSGSVLGKSYENVAQVPVQATVRVGAQVSQRGWLSYAAKTDGLWRWFRGPLVWPTAVPTATPTPLPTSTPTSTPTPRPTNTPYPTLVASPTAYVPIAPGSQAVVIVDATGLRDGPGDDYPVAWGVTRGTVLLVLEWPRWVEGLPWYRVQVAGTQRSGWAKGSTLAALAVTPVPPAPPTVTPTPSRTPTATPAPSRTSTATAAPSLTPTATPTSPGPSPTWLPLGVGAIAFTSNRDGNREVYAINPDGTGLRNLTRHPAQDADPSWSPAHDRLAFTSDRNGNNHVFVMSADGSGVVQLTFGSANQVHPAWSPNGAWIAYVSDEDGDWEISVMTTAGTGVVQLTHNNAWDSYPCWSPDSRKVAFTSQRDGNLELYAFDLATRTEARLTENAASDAFPAWSPTGNEIAFTSARDGPLELYLLDVTTVPQRVTRLTYTTPADVANRYPAWSSDGNWLAFTSWRAGNAEIYVVQRTGWGLRNLTTNPADDESPAWAQ